MCVCVCLSVHSKETTHTCTHTQRLGSHSDRSRGAAELQAMQEHLVLPPLHPKHTLQNTKTTPPNSHTRRNHRPPCKYKLCKPCKRGGLCASVDLKGWEWVNSTMTASGEPASSRTCTNPSLSLCLSLDLSHRRRGEVKGKLFLWFHA